jgi:hypothetical protein
MESLVSLENCIVDFQEEGEQAIDQYKTVEDMVEELEPKKNDEVSTCAPPYDEAIHEPFPPPQQEENEVSFFPFEDFDKTLFHGSESEEEVDSLNELDLACCTFEDEGATHEDETMMNVENTQVLKDPS